MLSKQEHTNSLPKSSHLPDCHANVCLYIIGCEYTYACCVYMLCIYDYMYVYTVLYVKRRYIGTIGRLFKRLPHKSLIQLLCKMFYNHTVDSNTKCLDCKFQISLCVIYIRVDQIFWLSCLRQHVLGWVKKRVRRNIKKILSAPSCPAGPPKFLKRQCHKIFWHFFSFINPTHLGPW